METENVEENSKAKLVKKQADMIAANCLREAGAGFGTDTNHLLLISADGTRDLPMMGKEAAADELLTELKELLKKKKFPERQNRGMIFAVDIGNSNIVIGLMDDSRKVVFSEEYRRTVRKRKKSL